MGYPTEEQALFILVNSFAEEMKTKLKIKLHQGLLGWNGTWTPWVEWDWTVEQIKCEIEQHLVKDDPVDLANLAVFWWYQLKKQERLDAEERKISIQSLDKENMEGTYLPKM